MGGTNRETKASYHASLLLEQGLWAKPIEEKPLLLLSTQLFLCRGITSQNNKCPTPLQNWQGKKCGWSHQPLVPCCSMCVLTPVQCQRSTPVFKKRHISSSTLEAMRKGCSVGKGCSSSTMQKVLQFPSQSCFRTFSLVLTIVPNLSHGSVLFPFFDARSLPIN